MSKRKKGHTEEHENIERWLITYADLITLLLGLFVVLYSMSQIDLNKYQQWISAFSQLFGGGGVLSSGKGILVTPIPPKSSLDAIANSSKPSSQQNLEAQLNAVLSSSIQSKKIMITTSTEGLTIHLLERLLFESGSADLKPEAKAVLDTLAEILKFLPNKIRVEGHTDNRPINTVRFPSNWHLSVARALNTAYYLMGKGVPPEKISIVGHSEYKPIAPNDTEENRAKNRRVDIVVISTQSGVLGKISN
ncbi:chemotaxis protein MotB [Candidatus Kryptonium thompsonii]|uniref:Chemotaxis protein MotB n=2 Tax=Candidatus Kryptonium thompsonii TaxID=1633631 RepID=A0A0P1MNG8_9BACT|nr:OmpA family protein [Candidatus Kryptonium thompsoni]CUS76636.1 chemotaxis protein MotB [Candidatus Kryptonium thompsoni]CUS82931.1 chemotaxis protein MotB [Candidatus Kryptonium thompsoni]CUS83931.1 chemotaxis protein MotB [Candidatus Kryptonium thompsoni]CUS84332.1 chemotaxis protein MotB [Candidatus Kryptonium thompsoni]CUS94470.1 chemotaxis protein MotB [Candidatus Kryptonium thompsoni]